MITKFSLGRVVATTEAIEAIRCLGRQPTEYLLRHQIGDWGDVPAEVAKDNDCAANRERRVLSVYRLNGGTLWIITDAERSTTCMLLANRSDRREDLRAIESFVN
jgi:hypothetical protein